MKISYNWLKSYIPEIPDSEKVAELLTFKLCEVEDVEESPDGDIIFNLKILPDRAHDLLSHQGVAREIAGLLGIDFKLPEYKLPENSSASTNLKIEIQTSACRRYMGRIIRGVKVGPSPEWMVQHLASVGQRSINNIVDATNIVMFDCGQPIHAFDLQQLLDGKIVVRNATGGEEIELVGSEKLKVKLRETDTMITDGIKNLAIAGVKGGLASGVSNETVDLLIEVANFESSSVRKTAKRLGISTDASKRFENDLSPIFCEFAMREISALILEMCPEAIFEEIVDVYPSKQELKKVTFESQYISKILGIQIKDTEIEKILKNYNYNFSRESNKWEVEVPAMRLDINNERDFVEEIGRVHGYDKISPEIPLVESKGEDDKIWQKIYLVKQKLSNDGYSEVMTYAFRDKGSVEVLASASDKNFLRTNLADGLSESISLNQKNLPLLDIAELKIFEVGTVFNKNGEQINVAYGDAKNITEVSLDEYVNSSELLKDEISFVVSPQGRSFKEPSQASLQKIFQPWSIYPFMIRDIAVWLPNGIGPEQLIEIYREFGTELLIKEPKLFDSFTKVDKTSFAYRLVFQASDRTLTDEEINQIMQKITEKIESNGWQVR